MGLRWITQRLAVGTAGYVAARSHQESIRLSGLLIRVARRLVSFVEEKFDQGALELGEVLTANRCP